MQHAQNGGLLRLPTDVQREVEKEQACVACRGPPQGITGIGGPSGAFVPPHLPEGSSYLYLRDDAPSQSSIDLPFLALHPTATLSSL